MMNLILSLKRLMAYWIDFILLALILCGCQWFLYTLTAGFPFDQLKAGYEIELWVLATISTPVWVYFICSEYYYQQTIGKRLMKIKVESKDGSAVSLSQIVRRTAVRLFPWETTHLVILVPHPWWSSDESELSYFIYIPNILIMIYIMVLFVSKGKAAVHDRISNTTVGT